MDRYILNGKVAVPATDMVAWSHWFEGPGNDRIVKQTEIGEDILVSTVFLALDHAFGGGKPLLFETLVFRGGEGCEQERCTTWEEAEVQHEEMVKRIRAEVER